MTPTPSIRHCFEMMDDIRASSGQRPLLRRGAAIVSITVLLGLSACGGGVDGGAAFEIGVVVAGQPVSGVEIEPGGVQNISIEAGESLELDASQPVEWTLQVGGTAVTGDSAVYYLGVNITEVTLSSSQIALNTFAPMDLSASVPITLTAISTIDSTQVATVNVLITN